MGALAMMSASHAAQGISSIGTGFAQSRAIRAKGDYEARMMEVNSRIAMDRAKDAERRGDLEAAKKYRETSLLLGRQTVSQAAQGIDVGSGSALEVRQDTVSLSEEDVATIKANAYREAMGYRSQSIDMKGQADLTRVSTQFAARQSMLTGITQGASSFAQSGYYGGLAYENYKKPPGNKRVRNPGFQEGFYPGMEEIQYTPVYVPRTTPLRGR